MENDFQMKKIYTKERVAFQSQEINALLTKKLN